MLKGKYAYSIGRIRVLETKLLNANEVERMIGAPDAKDAFRILNETDFATHLGDIEKLENFQEVINHGLLDAKNVLMKISPNQHLLDLLWFRYDIHNLKTLLKAKVGDKTYEAVQNYLMPLGRVNPKILGRYIFDNERSVGFGINLDDEQHLKQAVDETLRLYQTHNDSQIIDLTLNQAFFKIIYQLAKNFHNSFLTEFVQKSIDLANLNTFLRIKLQNRPLELLKKVLIPNGIISTTLLIDAFKDDLNQLKNTFKNSPYNVIISDGLDFYNEHKSFVHFEKLSDDLRIEFIKKARYLTFGPEPLIAYFWAKKNNALIIRMIMVGKLSNLDANILRERLRELYV